MAKAYNATCIVLKHTKLGETDIIVTMLASDGIQVRAVAKGLRKPGNRIGARLQLFSEVNLLLHEGKSLDIVREVKTLNSNVSLREDLMRTACASVISEFAEKLGRDGAQLEQRMYVMTTAAFSQIANTDNDSAALIAAAYLMKAMAMQGFAPAVHECALCGNPIDVVDVFDIGLGGAVCEQCAQARGLGRSAHSELAPWVASELYCTFAELAASDDVPISALLDLAQSWVREHLAINLKSLTFLKSLL